jgi:hypothetical protein
MKLIVLTRSEGKKYADVPKFIRGFEHRGEQSFIAHFNFRHRGPGRFLQVSRMTFASLNPKRCASRLSLQIVR